MNLNERLTATHTSAKLFDDGDHWQDGKAFLPFANADLQTQAKMKAELENSLESENVIAEVLDNEQNAVFGREPDWQVTPPDENQAELAEQAEKEVLSYWDDYNLLAVLKEANRRAATQKRAVIRAYVPKGLLTGRDRKNSLREAMDLIRFEVLSADKAAVLLDDATHQNYGLLRKTTADGKDYTELNYVENGKTVVKITEASNYAGLADETLATLKAYMPKDSARTDAAGYDLGGELLYFEVRRNPLITESIISNQKDINLSLTAKNRLTYKHAFPDLFFFNAKTPKDKDGKDVPIKTGGKSANFIAGEDVYDAKGENIVNYATPSMKVLEPTDPAHTIKSKEASAFAIYNQTSQVHLTKNDSAAASGVSKRESRFSFEKKCGELKQTIDPAGRWMLKVLVMFAADNLGQIDKYKSLRFVFDCRIDAGAPDAEEIAQAAADVKDGLLSEETYLSKYLRFDDADAEQSRLTKSESYQIAIWNKRLETAKAAREMGLPASEWVKILYPEDEEKQQEIVKVIEPTKEPNNLGVEG